MKLLAQQSLIFNIYCRNTIRLQDCDEETLKTIFGEPPDEKTMNFLGALEETFDCSGLCQIKLSKYLFSNYKRGDPNDTCDNKLKEFVNTLVDSIKLWMPILIIAGIIVGLDLLYVLYLHYCLSKYEAKEELLHQT